MNEDSKLKIVKQGNNTNSIKFVAVVTLSKSRLSACNFFLMFSTSIYTFCGSDDKRASSSSRILLVFFKLLLLLGSWP